MPHLKIINRWRTKNLHEWGFGFIIVFPDFTFYSFFGNELGHGLEEISVEPENGIEVIEKKFFFSLIATIANHLPHCSPVLLLHKAGIIFLEGRDRVMVIRFF